MMYQICAEVRKQLIAAQEQHENSSSVNPRFETASCPEWRVYI